MIAFVEHNTSHAHKQLLHQGFHLVEHQHSPHGLHGVGALACILVCVHIVAIAFLLYLFSRGAEGGSGGGAKRRPAVGRGGAETGASLGRSPFRPPPLPPRPIRCVADGPSSSALWR